MSAPLASSLIYVILTFCLFYFWVNRNSQKRFILAFAGCLMSGVIYVITMVAFHMIKFPAP